MWSYQGDSRPILPPRHGCDSIEVGDGLHGCFFPHVSLGEPVEHSQSIKAANHNSVTTWTANGTGELLLLRILGVIKVLQDLTCGQRGEHITSSYIHRIGTYVCMYVRTPK